MKAYPHMLPGIIRTSATLTPWLMICLVLITAVIVFAVPRKNFRILSVESGSMAPAIQKGDAVFVRDSTDYAIGDIVSMPSQDDAQVSITHRIVAYDKSTGNVTTRGDDNTVNDPARPIGELLGEVGYVLPKAGYLLSSIRTPYGLAVAVYFPAVCIIWYEGRRLVRVYQARTYTLHGFYK